MPAHGYEKPSMLSPATRSFEVRLEPLPDLDLLRLRWEELESRSRCSVFLSWIWIGTWLATICPRKTARLASVYLNKRLVGLGIVTARRRFFGLGPTHLRLHQVGDRVLDSLTIEFNGLLSETGLESETLVAFVDHLNRHERHWLTLFLPGIEVDRIPLEQLRAPNLRLRMFKRPTPYIDLTGLREDHGLYLSSVLGRNTRARVRRTARKLGERWGELKIDVAGTPEERLAYFDGLVALHQAHWTAEAGEQGAFADPRVVAFHRQLITVSEPGHGAQLLRFEAGGHVVGYLYHLVSRGVVCFYQAGIDYPRIGDCGSPGLLLLTEAVQNAIQEGHRRYELMAGDMDYKRVLAMAEGRMAWLSVDRLGLRTRLMDTLRGRRHGTVPA